MWSNDDVTWKYTCNDLKKVSRPTRTKPGMQEFFILILTYSYFNKSSHNVKNEFSIPQTVIADYFRCTVLTVKRWCAKLREIGCFKYAERDNASKSVFYKDVNGNRQPYTIPKYKKIHCGKANEIKFLNVYVLDQKELNQYIIEHVGIDVLGNIDLYRDTFNTFITFLTVRVQKKDLIDTLDLDNIETNDIILTKEEKRAVQKALNIHNKINENKYYLDIKHSLDNMFPEFKCKYLEEGCLRLTHEICSTVNPEHVEKINENNYWRSSHARIDMLQSILQTDIKNITEYDVNGSIYRLTYNINHDKFLPFSADIYKRILNNCNFKKTWPKDKHDSFRTAFKQILMPIYMKPYIIGYKASQWEYINKYYAGHPRKYQRLSKLEQEFYETYSIFVNALGISVKDFLEAVRSAMYATLNAKSFSGSNIFTIESNLHLLIRKKLLDKGIKCVNVYDGFYVVKSQISKAEFNKIYNESLVELKNNMKNHIGTTLTSAI